MFLKLSDPTIPFKPAGATPWRSYRLMSSIHPPVPNPALLTIDDDPSISSSLAEVLEGFFSQIDGATSSSEALQCLRKKTYDVIISDLQMPYLDGLTLLERLHTLDIHIPVILLSAYITPGTALRAFQLGVIDLISKPTTPSSVRTIVQDVLKRHALGQNTQDPLPEVKRCLNQCRFEEARVLLEVLLDEQEIPDARILLAMTYEVLGFHEKAEHHYNLALRSIDPETLHKEGGFAREWLLDKTKNR